MTLRPLLLALSLGALAAPALAADPGPGPDSAPVSTASETTDQKIAEWLKHDEPQAPARTHPGREEPLRDRGAGLGDRKIHGEVGAAVGSDGYRSAYGVATIPIGKTSSATVAISTSHSRYPWMAGEPWLVGPAGPDVSADCVCREAPDGSTICGPAGAASPLDAELAAPACDSTR